jgi:hypothetical protein
MTRTQKNNQLEGSQKDRAQLSKGQEHLLKVRMKILQLHFCQLTSAQISSR